MALNASVVRLRSQKGSVGPICDSVKFPLKAKTNSRDLFISRCGVALFLKHLDWDKCKQLCFYALFFYVLAFFLFPKTPSTQHSFVIRMHILSSCFNSNITNITDL